MLLHKPQRVNSVKNKLFVWPEHQLVSTSLKKNMDLQLSMKTNAWGQHQLVVGQHPQRRSVEPREGHANHMVHALSFVKPGMTP